MQSWQALLCCRRAAFASRRLGRKFGRKLTTSPFTANRWSGFTSGRTAQGTDAATPEEAASFKLNILNELINNQILVMHASHSRVTASEAEIDAKVGELKSPYSPEEFQKKLQEQGLDNDALRKPDTRKHYHNQAHQ